MEWPPFGKGATDIIWGVPFFGLIVLAFTIPGLLAAVSVKSAAQARSRLATVGLVTNGVCLAVPVLLLLLGVLRLFI